MYYSLYGITISLYGIIIRLFGIIIPLCGIILRYWYIILYGMLIMLVKKLHIIKIFCSYSTGIYLFEKSPKPQKMHSELFAWRTFILHLRNYAE